MPGDLALKQDLQTLAKRLEDTRADRTTPDKRLADNKGLAGEVRAVAQPEIRLAEAARLGFERAILPAASARHADLPPGLELVGVTTVAEALDRIV